MKPKPGESAERFIKRFMKKVKKFKIIEQIRDRRYYKKPTDARREAKKKLIREHEKQKNKTN
jgi:ribosomal protein S21